MSAMWNQWPVAAVPVAPLSAPPQPSVPPPLPDAPPPPPPADHIATDPAAEGVTGAGHAIAGYMASGVSQSASNPYEQYTAAQYAAMTPEQQYALQQHWQQWQIYQQEYAKWHAQYGEQYKREMAAAAATTTVPTVPPVPIAAPVKGSEPAIGPVYPQVQLAPQMTAQQSQIQTYFQHPPQSQSQLQLSGKIMAQPQMYNHPPPPPPQGYQQQLQPQLQPLQKQLPRQQQPTASNQWQHHHSPPVRFNKMLPVNYNQVQNSGDPSMFPNLQQPPPSFIQQPPLSAPVNQIDAPWSKEPNKNNIDRSNINDVDRHWYGPPDFGQQQQGPPHNVRWQSNEQGNNKNNANKPDSFGNRRNWQNNPSSNNKNSNYRNNPFSSAPLSRYNYDNDSVVRHTVDSPSGKFGGDAAGPGASNSNTTRGGGSYLSSSNMGNFGNNASGQGVVNNFGPGSFENSCRAGNTNGRWEHNHPNQSGNLGSSHNNNNDGGFNRAPNQKNFNQQQRATDLDEASFDRLFDQWEKQFEDWKCANANHPDRDEYRRYEEEFEKQRRRIAERREQMRRRRQLQNPQQSNQQPELYQQQGVKSRTRYDNYQENDFRCEQHNRDNIRNIDQLHKQISEADLEHELSNKFGEKEADYFETESKQQQESTNKKPEQVVETSAQSQQSSQKQKQQHAKNSKSATPSPTTTSKIQQKQPQQEVDKNKSTANILGKRKTDESINMGQSSTPAKHTKQENILIISLDDDEDDDADYLQEHQADKEEESVVDIPMNNIFKRNCGIPGLDLVADGQTEVSPCVSVASRATDASNSGNNKKIPSLFDVVISKPGISPPTNSSSDADKERSTTKTSLNESLPDDVNKVLKDPEFMNNLSQALAQAQGRDQELQQQQNSNERPEPSNTNNSNNSNNNSNSKNNNNSSNNEGRALSFAEWQRKKNNRASNQQDEEHTRSFGFGPESGNGSGNRGGYGPGKGGGFGSDQGQQKSGPSGGIPGANGPLSGPNFSGRQGNGSGPGPNSRHNASFGRNFGPCGSNNGNFSGSVPNFNERGHNFDPNFRDNGPGQVSVRPNFGVPIGLGPGPNFGGPGPFCGPGRMNTTGPFERNFGPGSKNSNERNINGANMSNNKNSNSFTDNPFRRNVGPSAPNFDECLLDGPGYTPHCKGQFRNNFANAGNNNKSWADGAESFGNFHPNEPVYRPMQVFDYQNSRNTAAKVIDYGHKSADTAGSRIGSDGSVPIPTMPDFRPVKTFDYGHASQNAVLAGPEASPLNRNCITNSNTKKKNKKKNKNRQRLFQQQQQQEQQSSMLTSNRPNDLHSTGAADQSTKQEELEDISDGEDNLTDATRVESPPPQPKIDKQPHQQPRKAFPANPQRRMLGESPAAIFPSTASASQQLHDQSETKRLEISVPTNENRNTISIDEVLLPPGRYSRPKRICIILRGPPGSGKSYVARLVKDKELEMGGANPRILSIDDYFIIENDYEEKCPKTGKKIPKKEILYEYDDAMEETYMQYLIKSFKKTLSDNLYDLIIVDCNNSSLRTLNEFYCHAKDSNFVPYIIDLHCDVETCLGRNSHQRSEDDIRAVLGNWCTTPLHYIKLDASTLLENVVEMEDVENMVTDNTVNIEEGATEVALNVGVEEEDSNSADAANDCGFLKSRWENDTTEENLARLDGTNRLMQKRKTASMAEFLQLDDWEPPTSGADGKKRVRWADIEEKRAQQKMRAIGFVVGQTDWKRMMDPNAGNRALNKTKYIERVNKRR